MKLQRLWVRTSAIAIASLLCYGYAWTAAYPTKPVRLVVAGPAGGGADVLARPISRKLSEAFGQQVIVDNHGGGAGIPASLIVLRSRPDGYTIFFANAIQMAVSPALRPNLPFDPVQDFSPVTLVATTPLVLAVHPSLPAKSVAEFVTLAKARPGEILVASNGDGTIQHLTIAMFSTASGIRILHVPHKGGPPAVLDTVGGHTQAIITALPTLLGQVRASRLRPLAVTSVRRASVLPDVPTVSESGWSGFEAVQWFAIFAPAKTPDSVIARWDNEVRRTGDVQSVRGALSAEGADISINGPKALAEFQRADISRWRKVVNDSGIKLR